MTCGWKTPAWNIEPIPYEKKGREYEKHEDGMIAVRLRDKSTGTPFWVLAAHFASGSKQTNVEERVVQHGNLLRFKQRLAAEGPETVLVCLDANCERDELESDAHRAEAERKGEPLLRSYKTQVRAPKGQQQYTVFKMRGMGTNQPTKGNELQLANIDDVRYTEDVTAVASLTPALDASLQASAKRARSIRAAFER